MTPDLLIRTQFPRSVREIENTWIPLPDGTRLAARIWLPEDAEQDPVPAILEYLPYRKRDGTVERDHLTHPYFAGFGYAGVRVDMRGTGDSEGVCRGEYLQQEQEDCLTVIQWLADQPWCSGRVGMIGISWGGFNGLQVAARQPEALGAVISLCSTDDRYADDIHFMGGAMLVDKLAWGATALSIAHTPPDPAIVGERWREMWQERLEGNGLWLLDWLRHQHRDSFYTHGSICEQYEAVKVPVYLVGGWADGYTNAIFRMLEHLTCPRKGLIGPWGHKYPHFAMPGPRIGFLQECLRWWDQHLKGIDTGIMEEPSLRTWIQHSATPAPLYSTRTGHWVTVPRWPPSAVTTKTLYPGGPRLADKPGPPIYLATPENTGHTAGNWCGYGVVPDGPVDQSGETGMVCFDTAPLEDELELLGFPVLQGDVISEVPQANLVAVLSDVAEDGRAVRISYGVLNLTHRHSHAAPESLPRSPVSFRLQLNACGQRIRQGHRLRLALSNAYWPVIWPSQTRARLTLTGTKMVLPIGSGESTPDGFSDPEGATPLATDSLSKGTYQRRRSIDLVSGVETCEILHDSGLERHRHTGMETRSVCHEQFTIHPDQPNSAEGTCAWTRHYGRGDWCADLDVSVTVRALKTDWQVEATLRAVDGDSVVTEKTWAENIPRHLV